MTEAHFVGADGWTADGWITVGPAAYDPETGLSRPRADRHGGRIQTLAWSEDGVHLASGGDDGAVLLWDPAVGGPLARLDGISRVTFLTWSGQDVFVSRRDGTCTRWTPLAGSSSLCDGPPPEVDERRAFLSPNGSVAVAAGWPEQQIWIVPDARTEGRPPRDLAVVGGTGEFPDPDALIGGLRAGRVAGDRVAYVAPGGVAPEWIDVEDPRAPDLLREVANAATPGDLDATRCHPETRLPPTQAGHRRVLVVVRPTEVVRSEAGVAVGTSTRRSAECTRAREVPSGDARWVLDAVAW